MLPLGLTPPPGRPLSVLAVGAHPDDIEIGAGGLLLSLAGAQPGLALHYLVLTGTPARHDEARAAAAAFAPGAGLSISLHDLPEGRLPANWAQAKDLIEAQARRAVPDLVLAPSPDDAHQDHRHQGRGQVRVAGSRCSRTVKSWKAAGPAQVPRFLAENFNRLLIRRTVPRVRHFLIIAKRAQTLN